MFINEYFNAITLNITLRHLGVLFHLIYNTCKPDRYETIRQFRGKECSLQGLYYKFKTLCMVYILTNFKLNKASRCASRRPFTIIAQIFSR